MRISIFSKTYKKHNYRENFSAIRKDGFSVTHFNFSTMGIASMPEYFDEKIISNLIFALDEYKIEIISLSATFNIIHPDLVTREDYFKRFNIIAKYAKKINTKILTLCTGTKDPVEKWKYHPDNDTKSAWDDFLKSMTQLLNTAEKYDLNLGIEPEINNIVNSPIKALKAIQELKNPRLGIIMDGANLFYYNEIHKMDSVLNQAFELLSPYIILAHAKDLKNTNPIEYCAAGKGVLNYPLYIHLLKKSNYQGPLILHSLDEDEVLSSKLFLESMI